MSEDLYRLPLARLDGTATTLAPWRGQVLLIVNTASRCGFTPQYTGLEQLYLRYRDQGFCVLGFPCNQFLWQEPGDAEAIGDFCRSHYPVSFPMFAKTRVNGPRSHPLYRHLKAAAPGTLGTRFIKWNFTKFLLDRRGRVQQRYGPRSEPVALGPAIEALLAAPPEQT